MFHNDLGLSRMLQIISEHSGMFRNVQECSRILWNVLEYS